MTTSTTLAEDRVAAIKLEMEERATHDHGMFMDVCDERDRAEFVCALMAAAAEPLEGLTASEWRDEYFRRHRDVQRIMIECNDQIQALTLERDEMRVGLSKIAEGLTPPEPHGHYLAHREAVKVARAALSTPSMKEDNRASRSQPVSGAVGQNSDTGKASG